MGEAVLGVVGGTEAGFGEGGVGVLLEEVLEALNGVGDVGRLVGFLKQRGGFDEVVVGVRGVFFGNLGNSGRRYFDFRFAVRGLEDALAEDDDDGEDGPFPFAREAQEPRQNAVGIGPCWDGNRRGWGWGRRRWGWTGYGTEWGRTRGGRKGDGAYSRAQALVERFGELTGATETPGGVEVHGDANGAEEGLGEVGAEVHERRAVGERGASLVGGETGEAGGVLGYDEIVEQDADGVDVRAHGGGAAVEELGSHVVGGAGDLVAEVTLSGAEAEVHEQDAAAFFAHDVFGLDVAVEEAGAVDGGKGSADVDADERGFAVAEGALRGEEGGKGFALDEVGPKAYAVVVAIDAVDVHDVGMENRGHGAGFAEHGLVLFFAADGSGEKELEGYFALEVRIPRAVDFAEAAGADAGQEAERAPFVAHGGDSRSA